MANELRSGITTLDELETVISDLFRSAIVDEHPHTNEVIIYTGFRVVKEAPGASSLEDMRIKGD